MGGIFLGHFFIIIKWTWEYFSQNFQFGSPLKLGTKKKVLAKIKFPGKTCSFDKSAKRKRKLTNILNFVIKSMKEF